MEKRITMQQILMMVLGMSDLSYSFLTWVMGLTRKKVLHREKRVAPECCITYYMTIYSTILHDITALESRFKLEGGVLLISTPRNHYMA